MIRHGGGVPGVLYNQVGGQLWHLKTHFEFYPFLKTRRVCGSCREKSFGLREPEQIISVCYTLCYVLKMVIKAFYMP